MGPDVGAPLGVTVTTCAGPPLMRTTDAVTVHVLATSMVTEKVGAVATNWSAAVPDSARVTVFVLDVVDIVVTEIVFAALSPDPHVSDAGL